MRVRSLCIALAAALCSPQLVAQHQFVSVGHEQAGDEVCVYYSAILSNILTDLSEDEVHCYPTGTPLDFPAGAFGFFLKNEWEGRISAHHGLTSAVDGAEPRFTPHTLEIGPGAFLDLSKVLQTAPKGAHLSVVIRTGVSIHPSVLPIPPGTTTAFVPAATPVVPILMQKGKPLWVGPTLTLSPNARETLAPPAAVRHEVIAAVQIVEPKGFSKEPPCECPRLFSNEFIEFLQQIAPPEIMLVTSSGETFVPEKPRALTPNTNVDVLIFRNVPSGQATLKVAGPLWVAASQPVTVSADDRVTLVNERLPAIVGGHLSVSWSVPSDVPVQMSSCEKTPPAPPPDEVVLLRCAGLQLDSDMASMPVERCEIERKMRLTQTERAGTLQFDGVADGLYLAELRYGGLPPARAVVTARQGANTSADLRPSSAFIQGRLTRAGKPAQASIVFFTGKSVSSSETGEYFTLLSGDPGRNLIRINACDDSFSYIHVPDAAPPLNGSYDIRIPENDFTVTVVDKATSVPLPAATLSFGPKIPDRPGAMQYMENWTVGAKGQAVLGPFALPLQGSICGHAQGYLDRCQDVELRKDHEELTLEMSRGESRSGRIDVRGYALVAWADGAGNVTELVPVEDDGTFRYESKHEPGETFFLLSPTLPLVALRQPALRPGDALEITIPHVPSRAFTIRLGEKIAQQNAFLDIQVGDILLPINVWGQHQRLRGQRSMITRRATLTVGAIAQTGPITVVLGPDPETTPPVPGVTLDDLFRRLGSGLQRAVVTSNEVVFGE
jgi:hypothetical protein